MELKKLSNHIKGLVEKYKFVILILVIGIILMLLPESKNINISNKESASVNTEDSVDIDASLGAILSMIDGAGAVEVMITPAKGEETLYQEDTQASSDANGEDIHADTVVISDSERKETGLIKQINPPIYMGAIVVCEGADAPAVKLAIVDAVSKVTGLGADKICVLKMK